MIGQYQINIKKLKILAEISLTTTVLALISNKIVAVRLVKPA